MKSSSIDANIRLTAEEGAVLLGKAEDTREIRTDTWVSTRGRHYHTYNSFREWVEARAAGIYEERNRTVEIYVDGVDERIAHFDKEGLKFDISTPERTE